jgi:hypothetical protein
MMKAGCWLPGTPVVAERGSRRCLVKCLDSVLFQMLAGSGVVLSSHARLGDSHARLGALPALTPVDGGFRAPFCWEIGARCRGSLAGKGTGRAG